MTGEELEKQLAAIKGGACAACAQKPAVEEGFCEDCLKTYRGGFVERLIDPTICLNAAKAGGKHVWEGSVVTFGPYGSVSCSHCGALAIDVDQWAAP